MRIRIHAHAYAMPGQALEFFGDSRLRQKLYRFRDGDGGSTTHNG
ncbi:hypothetical protein GLA29479_3806 [Lysobacter antibioticus]|nr:hypothetical protein GLA29479_3806 [Lysobacter antibioticus]